SRCVSRSCDSFPTRPSSALPAFSFSRGGLAHGRPRVYGRGWHRGGLAMFRLMMALAMAVACAPALASGDGERPRARDAGVVIGTDRKSTRLNSSHVQISEAG